MIRFTWIYLFMTLIAYVNGKGHDCAERRLLKELFTDYDALVRPRYNSTESVTVNVRFSLQQIHDLDEKRQILKVNGWLTAEWRDEFLTWDPENYGGIKSIVIPPSEIWVPKIAIGNSADKLYEPSYKEFWITVRSTGEARWQPGGLFAISCSLDITFYPFDDQKCKIEIETWVYTTEKVGFSIREKAVGLESYVSHGEWTVLSSEVIKVDQKYQRYQEELFPEVYVILHIRRKYVFYFVYILLPVLMLSGVLLLIFLLPPDSGEKVSLGVNVLVAISVFLLLVAQNVPDTSDAVPLIAIYLTYFMIMTVLSVAMSVLVLRLFYRGFEKAPPKWLKWLLFSVVGKMIGMKGHIRECCANAGYTTVARNSDGFGNNKNEDNRTDFGEGGVRDNNYRKDSNRHSGDFRNHTAVQTCDSTPCEYTCNNHISQDWKQIAMIVDRFFFWVFLICTIIPTSIILGFVRFLKPQL